jgi:hypothetical protein
VRLTSGQMTVPSAVASLITGVTGVDQNVATPDDLTDSGVPASRSSPRQRLRLRRFHSHRASATHPRARLTGRRSTTRPIPNTVAAFPAICHMRCADMSRPSCRAPTGSLLRSKPGMTAKG